MSLLAAWVAMPAVLGLICGGCGLLAERAFGTRIAGPLVPLVGFAIVVVVGQYLTLADATAELTTPAVMLLAAGGWIAGRRRLARPSPWLVAAALLAFAVYAAPIVLSGKATFAGYIKLDDTATWMALTDRVMDHGRSLVGLAHSTYEQTLQFNLASGYPIGVFLPLGVGTELVGQDVAWLVQPYMAFLGLLLALGLWELTAGLPRPALRGLVVFLASQPALLYGYYLWGGIKEMAGAALVAGVAGLAAAAVRARLDWRALAPLALAAAAVVGVLSAGGGIWLVPALLVALALGWRAVGARSALITAAGFTVAVVLLCIPVFVAGGLTPPTSSPLTSATALGNLMHPLDTLQLAGIWPTGDFRLDPPHSGIADVLVAIAIIGAVAGAYVTVRAGRVGAALYALGAVAAGLLIAAVGSPWVGGKALATASPAIPLLAAVAGAWIYAAGDRIAGGLLLGVIAAGVLWSNALAYRDVNLAPRDQLAELETIGYRVAGEGPSLLTEYQPYGARHFLRESDPESASELRYRVIPLVGQTRGLVKGESADTDRFQPQALYTYRTLVLRRSPIQSRPPSPYRLSWRGSYYEVWQRPPGTADLPVQHLGLGNKSGPAGVPRCSEVEQLAAAAGPGGSLAAVSREPVYAFGPGSTAAGVDVTAPGDYSIWLGGSVRPQVDLSVDGRAVGSVRHQLENDGEYVLLGTAALSSGRHSIEIRFHGSDLHPGSGGAPDPVGPVALTAQDAADTAVRSFPASAADELCGKPWDWIEALPR
jgi:hypothetical protein